MRAVPGALNVSLAGKEEGGLHVDTSKLTGGVEGVQRLCKALLSAKYIEVSMEGWGEELVSRVYSQDVIGLTNTPSSSSNCGRK